MPIHAECPLCGHKGTLPDTFQGKEIKCPECCHQFLAGDPVPAKTGGSHPGAVKSKPSGSAPGNKVIKPTGGSAQGNQVIKPTAGSAQGAQKKPPVKSAAHPGPGKSPGTPGAGQPKPPRRGTLRTLFAVMVWPFRAVAALRSPRTRRTLSRLAPVFWLLGLVILCVGGWITWSYYLQAHFKPEEQAKATAKTTAKTTETKLRWEEVFDVSKGPARLGPIHIRVMNVAVGPAVGKEVTDRENRFLLKIQIENKGTARVDYQGWSSPDPAGPAAEPVLIDSSDIKYKRVTFAPGIMADGQVLAETIHPDKWVNDLLVFEAPPDKVAFVKIELPAANLGAEGKVQLRIPRAMWGAIPPKLPDGVKDPVEPEPVEVKMYAEKLKSKLLADRRDAVAKLGELGPKAASAAGALAEVMRKDSSESVRHAAAEAIGKIGPRARTVIPQLIEALEKDEFYMVKAASAESLGRMGAEAKAALPALFQALTSKEDKVPAAAKEAILRIDPQAMPK